MARAPTLISGRTGNALTDRELRIAVGVLAESVRPPRDITPCVREALSVSIAQCVRYWLAMKGTPKDLAASKQAEYWKSFEGKISRSIEALTDLMAGGRRLSDFHTSSLSD